MKDTVEVPREFLETLHRIVADYDDMLCTNTRCTQSRYVLDGDLAPKGLCARHQSTSKAKHQLFDLLEGAKDEKDQ